LDLEARFFNEQRAGNVPVIAIFTKFDYLINQVYDTRKEEHENREVAVRILKEHLQGPLFGYKFPPRADVCLEDMHEDEGDHQERVKELIKKTADSLDNLALKILFISVQQNNLELCIQYAVDYAPDLGKPTHMEEVVKHCLLWFRHSYYNSYDYEKTEDPPVGGPVGGLLGQLRRPKGRRRVKLHQNIKEVSTFMQLKITDKSILAVFAALLICLENSFWYKSASMSFIDTFHKAFGSYEETSTQKEVEIDLKELGDWSGKREFKTAVTEVLFNHRLFHPDDL